MLTRARTAFTRQVNEKQKELSEEDEATRKALNLRIKVTPPWLDPELGTNNCVRHGLLS